MLLDDIKAVVESVRGSYPYAAMKFGCECGRIKSIAITSVPDKNLYHYETFDGDYAQRLSEIVSEDFYGTIQICVCLNRIDYIHFTRTLNGADCEAFVRKAYIEKERGRKCKSVRIVVKKSVISPA